jgi:3',5'-cyclic AMP phosphodiesterase CpdA
VTFDGLEPATQYAYRVGDGTHWSEWFHTRTGSAEAAPFSFIYMGDAQNGLESHWPRAIRAAYAQAPNAAFIVHAGDLVDRAHRDREWGAWNRGGSWVLGMLPNIPVPGNHEYEAIGEEATVEQTLALDARRTQEDGTSQLRGSVGLPGGETAPFVATRTGAPASTWAGDWSFQIAGSAYQGTLTMSEEGGTVRGALIAEGEELQLRNVQARPDQLTAAFTVELPDPRQEALSLQWRPQFTLPENGPAGMEETVYYLDYQGMRIIALNSNIRDEAQLRQQTEWLASVLEDSEARWTAVTFHHPVFSSAEGRSNEHLRAAWKPLFDRYQVDLVMQGHDHTYARGQVQNLTQGANARVPASGTVYVNSVSGSKMYEIKEDRWDRFDDIEMQRGAENTQLYQVIHVDQDTMEYRSYTVTGELYDAFDLVKQDNGLPNELVERPTTVPEERTHENTITYD